MKSHYFRNIAGATIMAFSLILGSSAMTTVQAQQPDQYDRYRRQQDEQLRRQQAQQYRRERQDRWRRNQDDQWNRYNNRSWDGYPNFGDSFDLRQTALNAGYNEGIKQGRKDRNRGGTTDFGRFSSYRNATKDYNSRLGDREHYRRYFQMAFQTGYSDGLRGY